MGNTVEELPMRKRSNSFSTRPAPATGIAAVAQALRVINPSAGTNPQGLCYQSAVEVAKVLTTPYRPPRTVDDECPDKLNAKAPQPYDRTFAYSTDRAARLWTWLLSGQVPAGAVFAVDMDEGDAYHGWNFVRGPDQVPTIFLIDVSTYVFKQVEEPADFCEWMTEYFTQPMTLWNYASPDILIGKPLDIYYWGQLAPQWRAMLQQSGPIQPREAPV
jgi:hypothetical protein